MYIHTNIYIYTYLHTHTQDDTHVHETIYAITVFINSWFVELFEYFFHISSHIPASIHSEIHSFSHSFIHMCDCVCIICMCAYKDFMYITFLSQFNVPFPECFHQFHYTGSDHLH